MIYSFRKANPNRQLYFLTKKEVFDKPVSRKWHKSLNTIPVDRVDNDIKTKKVLGSKNSSIMIHSEETRTASSLADKGNLGTAFIAMTIKESIIPIRIE